MDRRTNTLQRTKQATKNKRNPQRKKNQLNGIISLQSADAPSGHYFDKNKDTCEVCKKWTYKEISCRPKNEAANNEDCHEYGEHLLNRKCFKKNIVKGAYLFVCLLFFLFVCEYLCLFFRE